MICTVDENGFITLPDSAKAPVSVTNHPVSTHLVEFVGDQPVIVKFSLHRTRPWRWIIHSLVGAMVLRRVGRRPGG